MKTVSFLTACAAAALAVPVAATSALAKQCPSGQILRVSKGVCMDKAAAIKDGVIGGAGGKPMNEARLNPTDRARTRGEAQAQTVERSRASPALSSSTSSFAPMAIAPSDGGGAPSPSPSPYGALRLDYFR